MKVTQYTDRLILQVSIIDFSDSQFSDIQIGQSPWSRFVIVNNDRGLPSFAYQSNPDLLEASFQEDREYRFWAFIQNQVATVMTPVLAAGLCWHEDVNVRAKKFWYEK